MAGPYLASNQIKVQWIQAPSGLSQHAARAAAHTTEEPANYWWTEV